MKENARLALITLLLFSTTLYVYGMLKQDGPVLSESEVNIEPQGGHFYHNAFAVAQCDNGCAGFYNVTVKTADEYRSTHRPVWFFGMGFRYARIAAAINDNPNFDEDWATSSVGAHYVNANGQAISRWFSATTWDP